jgi:hypothetical protein
MSKRSILTALVLSLVLTILPQVAHAGVWDPPTTGGPFDIRWVEAVPTSHDRIKLTIGFWPGFTISALPKGAIYDRRQHVFVQVEGSPDGDFSNGFHYHAGSLFRRGGRLWLRNGEFGSSPCCWTTPVTRLDATTLRVRFIPWWVRWDEDGNDIPIRARVKTRSCVGENCVRDHTRWSYA